MHSKPGNPVSTLLGVLWAPLALIGSLVTLAAQFAESATTLGWRLIAWLACAGSLLWCLSVFRTRRPSTFDDSVVLPQYPGRIRWIALFLFVLSIVPAGYGGYITFNPPCQPIVPDIMLKLNNPTKSKIGLSGRGFYCLYMQADSGAPYVVASGVLFICPEGNKGGAEKSFTVFPGKSIYINASFADPYQHVNILNSREAILNGFLYKNDGSHQNFGNVVFSRTNLETKYIGIELE